MSTITKEWLQSQISAIKAVGITESNTLQAFEISLASLEAEPVAVTDDMAYAFHHALSDSSLGADEVEEIKAGLRAAFANVTAPPVPVSVPDDVSGPLAHAYKELTPTFMRNHIDVFERYGIYPDGSAGIQAMRIALDGMSRRAAMLQGAEPVTTAYKLPDDFDFDRFNDVVWLEAVASNPHMHSPTTSTIAMVALELNKRLETGNSQVVPDGYCIMPLKLTADNGAKGALCGEFHVQYRIVCQSCVGEGCEDCNHTGGWDAEIPVSWDTIKRIHEAAVEACTLPAAPQQEVK